MSFRHRFFGYLVVLHGAAFAVAVVYHEELGAWFFGIEALLIVSLVLGFHFVRRALQPLDFIQAFSDVLGEKEFGSRFSTVGLADMDQLIRTYNRMLADLYAERIRLGEQRGFVEKFLQASPVGVIILDFDGQISLINRVAADHLGSDRDPIGQRLGQINSPVARHLRNLPPGKTVLERLGARRLRMEHQSFVDRGFSRSFFVVEELTEILNESERAAYEKLIRMMSHEVNNTVASTNSLLESCRAYGTQLNADDRVDFEEAIGVVIRRCEHLNRFMRSFAQVVKLPPPRLERFVLGEMVAGIVLMFRGQCESRGIAIAVSDLSGVEIEADPHQLEQALINIIKNAMEAIDNNGDISIELIRDRDRSRLCVHDSGPGIDPSVANQLFMPFATSKPGGQGLGLTLVREILSRHGFAYALETKDERTTFWIEFPSPI